MFVSAAFLPQKMMSLRVGQIPGRVVFVVAQGQAGGFEAGRPAQVAEGGGAAAEQAPEGQAAAVEQTLGAAGRVVEHRLGTVFVAGAFQTGRRFRRGRSSQVIRPKEPSGLR